MTAPEEIADSTFGDGRPVWLGRLDKVRNVVRQEMISRQLDRHLRTPPARILDVGAGQGTQSIRLARVGHCVLAVSPTRTCALPSLPPLRPSRPRCGTVSACAPDRWAAWH